MSTPTYVVTFNCGRSPVQPSVFASNLSAGLPKAIPPPEILVLCLQEIAPISYAFLGGLFLNPYLQKFEEAVNKASEGFEGKTYKKVVAKYVGTTAIMVFVERESVGQVRNLQEAEVGIGLWAMGNKGAVGIRMDYGSQESKLLSLTFVSVHLAATEDAVKRRNEDWKGIVRGLVFEYISEGFSKQIDPTEENVPLLSPSANHGSASTTSPAGLYSPTSHLIVAGDLNYRTSSTSPRVEDLSAFPQPCEDDSYPQHYEHLLPFDQLTIEKKAGRTCHGLSEAPIEFPPTYKFSNRALRNVSIGKYKTEIDPEEGWWDWAEHRWPSWCDRVLYLDTPCSIKGKVVVKSYVALPLMATSDHRPVGCFLEIPAVPMPGSEGQEMEGTVRVKPPYAIDPWWMQKRQVARMLEMVVGILAFLTTTWEALWIFVALIFSLAALLTGLLRWNPTF